MRVFNQSYYLIVAFFLGIACVPSGPVDFKAGEYSCEFCHMDIVQMNFKAEILSPKGKVTHFDSIECMLAWGKQYPMETKSRWVTDYHHPQRWVPAEKAFYLRSSTLPSPMGAFLSAYATQEDLSQAQKKFGGKFLSLSELDQTIESLIKR